jgi:hypothetical protein
LEDLDVDGRIIFSINESPCHWGTKVQGPGAPDWGLNARLMTLLSKKECYYEIERTNNQMV